MHSGLLLVRGKDTTYYRHPIKTFDFTSEDGKENWTAYKFTKNLRDIWMPTHLKMICSVIDDLPPDLDFVVSQQSKPGESRLSQGDAAYLGEADSQSSRVGS